VTEFEMGRAHSMHGSIAADGVHVREGAYRFLLVY
jgi:hypothetical protein